MFQITNSPIDTDQLTRQVIAPESGAVVLFLGTTRGVTDGRQTDSLDYECYREMAEVKLAELEQTARQRWPIVDCAIVHRLGRLEIGEASVAVAVSTPHREDAFAAAKWLIDTLKDSVPIWKKENGSDGSCQWVHPGIEAPVELQANRLTTSADGPPDVRSD